MAMEQKDVVKSVLYIYNLYRISLCIQARSQILLAVFKNKYKYR